MGDDGLSLMSVFLPTDVACVEFDYFVSFTGEVSGCFLAAMSAATIKGYGLVFGESGADCLVEVFTQNIDVDSVVYMSLRVLFRCADIEAYDGGVGDDLSKCSWGDGLEFVGLCVATKQIEYCCEHG